MNWIFFALLAALSWTFSNFIDKYVLEKHVQNTYDFLFFGCIGGWIIFFGLLFFNSIPENLTWMHGVSFFNGIILVVSYGMYSKALEKIDTSLVIILFQLVSVMTLILGFLFLGQTLSLQETGSFGLIFLGAIIVSYKNFIKNKDFSTSVFWLLGAFFIWSGIFVVMDYMMETISFWDIALFDTLGYCVATTALYFLPFSAKKVKEGIAHTKPIKVVAMVSNSFFDLAAQICMKKSLMLASSAAMVTVVTEVQSLYGIILGVILTLFFPHIIKEDISMKNLGLKAVGGSIMFGGICLLFL